MTFTDLTHPDDAKREATLLKRMLGGDTRGYRIDKRIIEKKGKYREVEVTCAIAGSDDGAPFLIYVVDERAHTAQGQARPAAHNAEQLILAVVDQLTDFAVIRTDDKGLIAGWNAGAERILGYQRDDVVGRARRMLYRDHEHWAGKSTQQLKAASESGRLDLEDWRVAKDGRHLWVHTSITPVRIDGEIKGFVEIARQRHAGRAARQTCLARVDGPARHRQRLRRERALHREGKDHLLLFERSGALPGPAAHRQRDDHRGAKAEGTGDPAGDAVGARPHPGHSRRADREPAPRCHASESRRRDR
jgi:PAS domain S-box-containing protein